MKQARGQQLDNIGLVMGIERWRWWIFAWPIDYFFRKKILRVMRGEERR